jgi:hypothetical protein
LGRHSQINFGCKKNFFHRKKLRKDMGGEIKCTKITGDKRQSTK